MTREEELLFLLVRIGMGVEKPSMQAIGQCREDIDWEKLYLLTTYQSVSHIVCDALEMLFEAFPNEAIGIDAPQWNETKLKWYAGVVDAEMEYERQKRTIAELAASYAQNGIGMMMLKGLGMSQLYPTPSHRPLGDLDIYLFDLNDNQKTDVWKRGDNAIKESYGIEVRGDSEHHTKFMFKGLSVENHYDFVNTRIRKSSRAIEKIFKELALDATTHMDVCGQTVYLPNTKLNALFLLRHSAGHFAAEGIMLRNVLDWACFIKHAKDMDWEWLYEEAKRFNMHRFLSCMNEICTTKLGFDSSLFPTKIIDKDLSSRVLKEILNCNAGSFNNKRGMIEKTRLWWQHRWKHRICYSDSMLSSFLTSVYANTFKRKA